MRWSRGWAGVCAVAVAVAGAVALAWPAFPATPSGTGILVVSSSPSPVVASQPVTLTFSFTAPANPPLPVYYVTLTMPTGWTASPPSGLTCVACSPKSASGTQIEIWMQKGATGFTLTVPATPPGYAGPATFTATEQFDTSPPTTWDATPWPLTVNCPTDDLGTMAVAPSTVAVASSAVFTFTYTAGSCGTGAGGTVGVTVPSGWSSPGPVVAPADNPASGTQITFTYGPAQASFTGPATFSAWQAASDGPAQSLAAAPVVMVTQVQASRSPTPTPTTSSPSATSTSPSSSPATSPQSSHARNTGPTTGTTSPGRPTHSVAGGRGGLPIALVASGAGAGGLILLAGVAGLLASRSRRRGGRLRRGGHGTGEGSVRAVPHTGPPPSVAVRNTAGRPALTVRLEPHAGATVTTIEEKRP
jgi:hypothetical protein